MDELKLYYERDGKKVYIVDSILFNPVEAGKLTVLFLVAESTIKYPLDVELSTDDSDIQIITSKFTLPPKESMEIKVRINPNITRMNPIRAKLNVKLKWVVT